MAALAGEEKGDLSGGGRGRIAAPVGELDGGAGARLEALGQGVESAGQLLLIAGDHRQAVSVLSVEVLLALLGHKGEGAVDEVAGQKSGLVDQARGVSRARYHQLATIGANTGGGGRGVLFKRQVEVGAAETKGGDRCAPRVAPVPNPGSAGSVDIEGAVIDIEARVGLVHLDGRREHLVV